MKTLILTMLLSAVSVAHAEITPASVSKHDTRLLVSARNIAYQQALLAQFETMRVDAVKAESFTVSVPYTLTGVIYPVLWDLVSQLRNAGYDVQVNRLNSTLDITWDK